MQISQISSRRRRPDQRGGKWKGESTLFPRPKKGRKKREEPAPDHSALCQFSRERTFFIIRGGGGRGRDGLCSCRLRQGKAKKKSLSLGELGKKAGTPLMEGEEREGPLLRRGEKGGTISMSK